MQLAFSASFWKLRGGSPALAGEGKTIHAKCNYKLVADDLMDPTHKTFVRGGLSRGV